MASASGTASRLGRASCISGGQSLVWLVRVNPIHTNSARCLAATKGITMSNKISATVRKFRAEIEKIGRATDTGRLLVWTAHEESGLRGEKLVGYLFGDADPVEGFRKANVNRITQAGIALRENGDEVTIESLHAAINAIEESYRVKRATKKAEPEGESVEVTAATAEAVSVEADLIRVARQFRALISTMGQDALPVLTEVYGDAAIATAVFAAIVKANRKSANRETVSA